MFLFTLKQQFNPGNIIDEFKDNILISYVSMNNNVEILFYFTE